MRPPFKAILFLLPLLFAQTAYGDINSKLLKAAEAGDTAEVERLLGKGADVNAKDEDGRTAFMRAVFFGHAGAANFLMGAGADVNAKDKSGRTILMWTAKKGYTEAAKVLIDGGADVNAKDEDGKTALMFAAIAGHTETVKALMDAGADVNAKNKNGQTALMSAAQEGRTETAKALIEAGADVNAKNEDGTTALLLAAAKGHTGTVRALMEAGADVNAKNKDSATALIIAALKRHTETVKALIEAGADVNAKDKYGKTALSDFKEDYKATLLHYAAAVRLMNAGKFKEAIPRWKYCMEYNQRWGQGWSALGDCYLKLESYGNALKCYTNARKSGFESLTMLTNLIVIYLQKGEDAKAKELLQRVNPEKYPAQEQVVFYELRDNPHFDKERFTIGIPDRPPAPVGPLTMGVAGTAPPKRVHYVEPKYPFEAKKVGLEGHVILEIIVDERGNVIDVAVVQGGPLGMTESAVEAVWKWKYEPSTLHGKPIRLKFTVIVRFTLY